MAESHSLCTCSCCGLVQALPPIPAGMRAACSRCGTSLRRPGLSRRSNSRTAATALAALILYPLAVSLPMLNVRQLGHQTESSILQGIAALWADGQLIVGTIVLLCSVVFPLGKLISLLLLTTGRMRMAHRHKAMTYRLIQWTGRWGMMDVLLVAILVAVLKLGNVMDVTPGPGALAFATCVVLSLLASASFDPHNMWEGQSA